jgi:hypothetical protein
MRTLCLILPNPPKGSKSCRTYSFISGSTRASMPYNSLSASLSSSYAEQFLRFSPRICSRSSAPTKSLSMRAQTRDDETLIFIDLQSMSSHFENDQTLGDATIEGTYDERQILKDAKELALQTYASVKLAIADNPWVAQALAEEFCEYIGEVGNDLAEIAELPLRTLPNLEGILPWNQRDIRAISTFFELLGFKKVREIKKFSEESFRERWGKVGGWLWKKLNLQDQQVISPLEPTDSLVEYMHLDDPTYLISFLLYSLEINLKNMCLRLEGRSECAHKIHLNLYCEYSNQQHRIEIHPAQPTRDLELILQMLEHRLSQLSLENPIRHFDIEITPVPENIQQLDLFESNDFLQEAPLSVSSLLKQSLVAGGFLRLERTLWPEDSMALIEEDNDFLPLDDVIEVDAGNFKIRPIFENSTAIAQRPTKLLDQPRPMSDREVHQLTFLSSSPMEKAENSSWSVSRGRDYFWAISQRGQNLWVFKDHVEQKYYLHGYLD